MSTESIGSPSKKSNGNTLVNPGLVAQIDGKRLRFPATKLLDEKFATSAEKKILSGKKPSVILLDSVVDLAPHRRTTVLDFLVSLQSSTLKFRYEKGDWESDHLFDAALKLLVGTEDLEQYGSRKRVAFEVAALMYPDALDGACDRIAARLKELGVKKVSLIRDAEKVARELDPSNSHKHDAGGHSVISSIADAPVSDHAIVPIGWNLSSEGIVQGNEIVVPAPFLITKRHTEINEGRELLTIAWKRDNSWHERTVERAVAANNRTIVEHLADFGAPVTTNNAKLVVQFLTDFESQNLALLPTAKVSRQLGWLGAKGKDGFLCGAEHISAPKKDEENTKSAIVFRGADEGDEQIAAGFHVRGTYDKWRDAISVTKDFPKVRLALYASFVPPLLSIFESSNFVLSFCGTTSCGKTATLRTGASVWGNPDAQSPPSLLNTWDVTATWRERAASVLNNLPLFLDDTKHARHEQEIAKTIYAVAQGIGRGRGTTKGLARLESCRTVLFTSGEQPITSHTEDGGTRPRVLNLWGSPFGKTDAKTGKLVRVLTGRIAKNYGHAGPLFVRYLIELRAHWVAWKKEYHNEVRKYEKKAAQKDNPFAGRMAAFFASIITAAWLVHGADLLPWDYEDPIEPLWDELIKEAGEANRSAAALRYVMDWAHSHQAEFFGRERVGQSPYSGWAGHWEKNIPTADPEVIPEDNWPWIGFIPAKIKTLLKDGGFEPESTLRQWKDAGWLLLNENEDGSTRRTYKARVGEEGTTNLIAIRRHAVEMADQE